MLYDIVLSLHIIFVIGLFASLAMDGLAVARLRHTNTADGARVWVGVLQTSAAFGPLARVAVLGAGLYLSIAAWSWQGWIVVALVSWLALVLLGEPLTGKDLRQLSASVRAESGALSPALASRLHDPRLWFSVLSRAGLGAGVVCDMTVKPPLPGAAALVVTGAALGVLASRWRGLNRRGAARPA